MPAERPVGVMVGGLDDRAGGVRHDQFAAFLANAYAFRSLYGNKLKGVSPWLK